MEFEYGLGGYKDRLVLCRGTWVPHVPANLSGHPDDWAPAEGGYPEDLEIYLSRSANGTTRARLLHVKTQNRLSEDGRFMEALELALQEQGEVQV